MQVALEVGVDKEADGLIGALLENGGDQPLVHAMET